MMRLFIKTFLLENFENFSFCITYLNEGVDRGRGYGDKEGGIGGGGGGIWVEVAESGVEGAGSGDRGGGESGKIGAGN